MCSVLLLPEIYLFLFRNRKDCDFYHPAGEKLSQAKLFRMSQAAKALVGGREHGAAFRAARAGMEGEDSAQLQQLCTKCGGVARVLENCCKDPILIKVSREQLSRPCSLIQPKVRKLASDDQLDVFQATDKKEAQYFFSTATTSLISTTITNLGFTDVLCIGCPSIFETLPKTSNSLLLDLDPRFEAFFPPDKFLWYNFFNGHAFQGDKAKTVLQNFLIQSTKLLVLLDPPFGAKSELISHSLEKIKEQAEQLSFACKISTIWVFPYFMEKQVSSPAPVTPLLPIFCFSCSCNSSPTPGALPPAHPDHVRLPSDLHKPQGLL